MDETYKPWVVSFSADGICTRKGICKLADIGRCKFGTRRGAPVRGSAAAETAEVARVFADADLLIDIKTAEAEQQEMFPRSIKNGEAIRCDIRPHNVGSLMQNTATGDRYALIKGRYTRI